MYVKGPGCQWFTDHINSISISTRSVYMCIYPLHTVASDGLLKGFGIVVGKI